MVGREAYWGWIMISRFIFYSVYRAWFAVTAHAAQSKTMARFTWYTFGLLLGVMVAHKPSWWRPIVGHEVARYDVTLVMSLLIISICHIPLWIHRPFSVRRRALEHSSVAVGGVLLSLAFLFVLSFLAEPDLYRRITRFLF